jgi:hypothetical protein
MLAIARWTQPDYVEKARSSGRAQLLTIPYSHYVELARWTMEVQNQFMEHGVFRPTLTNLLHKCYKSTPKLLHNNKYTHTYTHTHTHIIHTHPYTSYTHIIHTHTHSHTHIHTHTHTRTLTTSQLAGRPYEEQWFMPGQHVLPLLSLRVAHSSGQLHLSSSSFVAKAGRPVDTYSHKAATRARCVVRSSPPLAENPTGNSAATLTNHTSSRTHTRADQHTTRLLTTSNPPPAPASPCNTPIYTHTRYTLTMSQVHCSSCLVHARRGCSERLVGHRCSRRRLLWHWHWHWH